MATWKGKGSQFPIVTESEKPSNDFDPLIPTKSVVVETIEASPTSEISPSTITTNRAKRASLPPSKLRKRNTARPIERLHNEARRWPPAVKFLIGVFLTGLTPSIFLAVSYTALHNKTFGPKNAPVKYTELALWIELIWASLIVTWLLSESFARAALYLAQLSKHWVRYARVVQALSFRMTMVFWAVIAHQTNQRIFHMIHKANDGSNWVSSSRTALQFIIIAFTIMFFQGLLLQLIAVRYIEGFVGPRSARSFDELETLRTLNALVKPVDTNDVPGLVQRVFRYIFALREDDLYHKILQGRATDVEYTKYATMLWHAVDKKDNHEALTSLDITNRVLDLGRDADFAADLFWELDTSGDGKVSREELENLVKRTGYNLQQRATSMRGIQQLLGKLEIILTLMMLVLIMFIYTVFYNHDLASKIGSLWSGIVALGFAIGGAVSEFVSACVFVFAKHAYDVGDDIEVKGKSLKVIHIHLTHTDFEEKIIPKPAEDAAVASNSASASADVPCTPKIRCIQFSHAALTSEGITNLTRSRDAEEEDLAEAEAQAGVMQ